MPFNKVVVTNQFDVAETNFLVARYGIDKNTVPEILSLIEFAQDFTAATNGLSEPDWRAMEAVKERKDSRSKERRMFLEAETNRVIAESVLDFVEEFRKLGFQVEVLTR